MKTIHRDIVGAFIFSKEGKLLLGKNIAGKTYQGLWTIPGGGVEAGESATDAVIREIFEEVGIDISQANKELLETKHGESTKTIQGEVFLVKMTFHDFKVQMLKRSEEIIPKDGDDFEQARWVDVGELRDLEIAPPTKMTLRLFHLI